MKLNRNNQPIPFLMVSLPWPSSDFKVPTDRQTREIKCLFSFVPVMSEFVLVRASVLAVSVVHQNAYLLDCALSIFLRMLLKFARRKTQVVQFYSAPNNCQSLQSHPHYLPQSPYERTGVR